MAVSIANSASMVAAIQNNIVVANNGDGVVSGLAVTEKGGGADMSVDVASGTGIANETTTVKGSTTNVVITAADGTNPRYDLITFDGSGTLAAVAGTPAVRPEIPDLPANEIALAYVLVGAGVTQINDADITDIRITVRDLISDFDVRYKALFGEIVASGIATVTGATAEAEILTSGQLVGLTNEYGKYRLFVERVLSGGGTSNLKLRIDDGTTTVDNSIIGGTVGNILNVVTATIFQHPETNTVGLVVGTNDDATTLNRIALSYAGLIADWSKSAHTISLRADVLTSGTLNVKWILVRYNPD